jgi:hypothetical protein
MIQLASPMFIAGEVLLGLSLTVFISALIATVADTYRSRHSKPWRRPPAPRWSDGGARLAHSHRENDRDSGDGNQPNQDDYGVAVSQRCGRYAKPAPKPDRHFRPLFRSPWLPDRLLYANCLRDRRRCGLRRVALLLCAGDHDLGVAVATRTGRSVDMQGGSAGTIGAQHDLAGVARNLWRIAENPEARAGARRPSGASGAGRTSRAGRSLIALVTLVSFGAARDRDERGDGDAGDYWCAFFSP